MPELPEVETVRRTLAPIVGARITRVRSSGLPLRMNQPVPLARLRRVVKNGTIEEIRRRGKYLLVDISDRRHSVLFHLGMSGQLLMTERSAEALPHTHLVLELAGCSKGEELRFVDPRRFGLISLVERGKESEHPSLAVLGPDPIEDHLDGELIYRATRGVKRRIKELLLDQAVLTGVGNIYASEALWQAAIRPTLRAHRLSRARAEALAAAIGEVLHRAIEHSGTSLKDFVDGTGRQGDHSHYLWVYGREGQPCRRRGCSGVIRRQVMQGRATFFCPGCQKR